MSERSAAAAQGYPLTLGDVQTVRLTLSFDVVLAGEVIEHLTCLSAFFATGPCAPDGRSR